MPIVFALTTSTGTACHFHKAMRIEIDCGVRILVNSWASKAIHDAAGPLAWQDVYGPMPVSALAAQDPLSAAEAWLIAAGSPMAGGLIDDSGDSIDLTLARSRAWERIKASRDSVEFGSFEVKGIGTFDGDSLSQQRIVGAVVAARVAGPDSGWSIVWTLADDSTVILDHAGMIEVGSALADHIDATFSRARKLRALIAAAESVADVDAINWSTQVEILNG